MATINIGGLDRAVVLQALYNAAVAAALHGGYSRRDMDMAEAEQLLEESAYFGYVNGRAIHVDLTPDELETYRYDAANGRGCAERALAPLLATEKA